ncbi:cadherin domain-containing protein [Alphaproteobacteria bacterium]|nr:cadherin domain-containing protein [Alphaproteobacteria bacterium]
MSYTLDGYDPFTLARDTGDDVRIGSLAGTAHPDGHPYTQFQLLGASREGSDASYFRIDENGVIWTTKPLNIEYDGPYRLIINAFFTSPAKSGIRQICIDILVAEDDLSIFMISGQGLITENVAGAVFEDISITTSSASAVNDVSEWTIAGRDAASRADADKFEIVANSDNSGYVLKLKAGASLDYEADKDNKDRNLAITVRDSNNNLITKTVTISIKDEQETPVIRDPQTDAKLADDATLTAYVASDAEQFYRPVITLNAFDGDGDTLSWRVKSGNVVAGTTSFGFPKQLFGIYGNDLTLISDMPPGATRYVLVLEVKERYGGKTDEVTVIVEISDTAAILTATGTGMVVENAIGADTGITFTANHVADNPIWSFADTDNNDLGDRYEVVYDGTRWSLRLKDGASLNYEEGATQTVVVTLHNGADATMVNVNIAVADVDEAPVFTDAPFEVTIAENFGISYSFFRFGASDPESGVLSYRIIGGNDENIFTISRAGRGATGGVIYLEKALDYETARQHILDIELSDASGNIAVTTVTVTITNIDEGAARFTIDGTIADTPIIGNILTASIDIDDPDGNGNFAYQWFADADGIKTDISGATAQNYIPVTADAGKKIGVRVSYIDAAGKSEMVEVITVYHINAIPVITSDHRLPVNLAENVLDTSTPIVTIIAADADGDMLTYTITGGNTDALFVIDNMTGVITLAAGKSLNFETAPFHTLRIEVSDGVDKADIDVHIHLTNIDEGNAVIGITATNIADLESVNVGDILNATILISDPDGLAPNTVQSWRWFHKHNPDATIGTGDSYTLTGADRGYHIGVEYSYTDHLNLADNSMSTATHVLTNIIPRLVHQQSDLARANDNNIVITVTATTVDAGDGSDNITGGAGNDEITGGKGDDNIDLGASDTDTDVVIYGIGGQSAKDGGDHITNFNRGVDQFVFALDSNQAGVSAVTDYDSFLDYITKDTVTLDDDEFRVQLDLGKDADGKTQIEGLFFHFASATFYSGGRASLPLMKISFADPIDEAGITNIFTDENGQPVDASQVLNNYFFITNLDYLDDFMGGADSISYEIA